MRILLGVTGGIAAYKATGIIRLLTEADHDVKVIPTQNALRFIGSATLEALSHNSVDPDLYSDIESVKHVQLGKEADLVIVAPATAAFLARFANGIVDDLLLNTLLVTKAPVLVAPAMHSEMWQHPSTIENVERLRSRGVHVIEPAEGRLTGEDSGPGRLPEPSEIVSKALDLVREKDLSGQHLLITAGGTHEHIDPVRYIGNSSSGKQGLALATEAKQRGARVTLVAANLESTSHPNFDKVVSVVSAQELAEAVYSNIQSCSALIMAAAVSDFRVALPSEKKIKRSDLGDEISIHLLANPDILKTTLEKVKEVGLDIKTIGFAAETSQSDEQLVIAAKQKLQVKACDFVVANNVSGGAVFGSDQNRVFIVGRDGTESVHSGSKTEIANHILDLLI